MIDIDMTPRYAPSAVVVVGPKGSGTFPVLSWHSYPPGQHPKGCHIKGDMTAVECRTSAGSRRYGCERAYINSELRFVVVGTNPRDEVRMKWEVCRIP